MRYHISPTTGRPNKCNAQKNACPLGGKHYDSKEEARAGYELDNNAMPAGHKKVVEEDYGVLDLPLTGLGRGVRNLEKSQARRENFPQLTIEQREVDGDWVTDVYGNGELTFTVPTHRQVELIDRAREAGEWSNLKELVRFEPSSVDDLDDFITFVSYRDEVAEEVEALEEDLERMSKRSKREQEGHQQSLQIAYMVQRIAKKEAWPKTPPA